MKKVLLISGGMDSGLLYLRSPKKFDKFVFFRYGQESVGVEASKVKELVKGEVTTIKILQELQMTESNFYYARNLKMCLGVCDTVGEDLVIYFGTCADDEFPDNNRRFFRNLAKVLRASYPFKIKILTPLAKTHKKEIYAEYKSLTEVVPTWCEKGTNCGECHSCKAMKGLV